jgi:hypothetical protein
MRAGGRGALLRWRGYALSAKSKARSAFRLPNSRSESCSFADRHEKVACAPQKCYRLLTIGRPRTAGKAPAHDYGKPGILP